MKVIAKDRTRINLENCTDWARNGNQIQFFTTGIEEPIGSLSFADDYDAIAALAIIDEFCCNLELFCQL